MLKMAFLLVMTLVTTAMAQDILNPPPTQGLRLVNGQNIATDMGTVQVFSKRQEWNYICDDGFGFAEADAICRQMGLLGAERYTRNDYFRSITLDQRRNPSSMVLSPSMNCSEHDGNYEKCPPAHTPTDCAVTEVAGVVCLDLGSTSSVEDFMCKTGSTNRITRGQVCDGIRHCSDGSDEADNLCTDMAPVKLQGTVDVNIPGAVLGSVRVKYNERWGVMCDDGVTEKDAKVVCRTLGYQNGWSVPFTGSYLGEALGPMIVDTPQCTGSENSLAECPGINFGESDCPTSQEDFGVFCYDEGVDVRLTGAGSQGSGQVELKLSGKWGSLCDHGFDIFDAQVICRMLGYDGDAIAHRDAGPSSSGSTWGIRLDCLGKEKDIQDCRIRIIENSCPLSRTASVTCSRSRGQVEATLKTALGNSDCGIQEDASNQFITSLGRVLGGDVRSRFDTPWLIALRRPTENGPRVFCGGSIISEDYIVTAAHCLDIISPLGTIIRVGDFNANIKEESEQEFSVEKAWVHEHADEHAFNDNDIALIKIQRENGQGIRFGPRVKPICLPSVYDNYEDLSDCSVTGWGPTFFLDDPEVKPREGQTNIISDYTCEGSNGGPANYTSSIVCVGQFFPRVNACKGDSGGPLACPKEGKMTLYGLVSSGRACTFRRSADMYTRVSKFSDWILSKIMSTQRGR